MKKIFSNKYFALFVTIAVFFYFVPIHTANAGGAVSAVADAVGSVFGGVADAVGSVISDAVGFIADNIGTIALIGAAFVLAPIAIGALSTLASGVGLSASAIAVSVVTGLVVNAIMPCASGLTKFVVGAVAGGGINSAFDLGTGVGLPSSGGDCNSSNSIPAAAVGTVIQTSPTTGGTCYGPLNSCGQAYSGTWQGDIVCTQYDDAGNCTAFYGGSCSAPTYAPPDSGCPQPVPLPDCAVNPSPATINQGQISVLVWGCQNADSATMDNGIGSVPITSMSGNTTNNPNFVSGGAKSWQQFGVSPSKTTTYNLTAVGAGGTASFPITVNVNATPPATITSVTVSPISTALGTPATLSWTSSNANSCTVDNGIGTVSPNSSTSVNPSQTTTYTVVCTGAGGTSAPSTATLTVYQPPSCSNFSASPSQIVEGSQSTLSWSCSNVDNSCSLSAAQGTSFTGNGSYNVSPTRSTDYTLSCTGNGGTRTFNTSLTVYEKPVCTFSANPQTIIPPQSSSLNWNCTKTTSCSVAASTGGNIGSGGATGSVTVSPRQTTSYTLSCVGAGNGTIQAQSSFQTILKVTNFNIKEIAP